ncbi:MAG: flagellar hook-associated protein FlgK [Gammaproteobacteria bacterium]|nr:flagellar hook-associated protein FlgK [Gammaproteobacteria bacterium]
MPDMLNTAVSGLLTFQRALSTTSHNISNVNTEGYSRQNVEIATNTPTSLGDSFYGNGSHIDAIARSYDQFLTKEVRDTTSVHSRLEKFGELTAHLDDVLADPQGGVAPILQEFFVAVQDVADDPTSSTARIAMMDMGDTLASRFQSIDNRFQELSENTAAEIRRVVDEINDLVLAIRDVNIALTNANAGGNITQQSSDLLDKRDLLLNQLAERVDISVVNEQENHISIFIGNGQTVLSDTVAFPLSTQASIGDPTRDSIAYNGLITVTDISSNLTGGELGGLLEFRRTALQTARNSLGRTAIALAETMNAQMRDGMDLNGNLGQDFFTYRAPEVYAFTTNTGTATVSGAISDATTLTLDNYVVDFDGANWNITSDSGTTASVPNGAPATLVFEGLTLTINGAGANPGDRFTIKPTLEGSSILQVAITDPREIAAALPIRTQTSLSNLGQIEVSPGIVTDVTDPNLLNTVTFTFDSPATSFTSNSDVVVGGVPYLAGASIPFSNNMVIDANGWQTSISGTPQPGDVFTVESNVGGVGDNRNALNLANLQHLGVLDGGIATIQEDYGRLVGYVGSITRAAGIERDAQESLLVQAIDRKDSRVGVNLDEEAADMIRYQQAYEATARIISTVQTMFETLLNSVR